MDGLRLEVQHHGRERGVIDVGRLQPPEPPRGWYAGEEVVELGEGSRVDEVAVCAQCPADGARGGAESDSDGRRPIVVEVLETVDLNIGRFDHAPGDPVEMLQEPVVVRVVLEVHRQDTVAHWLG